MAQAKSRIGLTELRRTFRAAREYGFEPRIIAGADGSLIIATDTGGATDPKNAADALLAAWERDNAGKA